MVFYMYLGLGLKCLNLLKLEGNSAVMHHPTADADYCNYMRDTVKGTRIAEPSKCLYRRLQ